MQGPIAATVALIAGLTAAGQSSTAFDVSYMDENSEPCGIYMDQSADGTYLAAYAAEGLEGEYVFSLRQAGPNGSSQITQSGEIDTYDEGPTLLSEMTLDLSGDFEASLQTYSWDGEFTCRVIV